MSLEKLPVRSTRVIESKEMPWISLIWDLIWVFLFAGVILSAVVVPRYVEETSSYRYSEDVQMVHYTVKPGDTLWSIAGRFTHRPVDQTIEQIRVANGIEGSQLRAGQHLVIPM